MTTPDQLADMAAYLFHTTSGAIFGQTRTAEAVQARQALAWVLRQQGWSLKSIGAYLQRDHTTIMYSLDVVDKLQKRNARYAERLMVLSSAMGPGHVDWMERIAALERRVEELETALAERTLT